MSSTVSAAIEHAVAAAKKQLRAEARSLILNRALHKPPARAEQRQQQLPHAMKHQLESIAACLHDRGLEYSLSVFVAEAGLDPTKSYVGGSSNIPILSANQQPGPSSKSLPASPEKHEKHHKRSSKSFLSNDDHNNNNNMHVIADRLMSGMEKKYNRQARKLQSEQQALFDVKVSEIQARYEDIMLKHERKIQEKLTEQLAALQRREREAVAKLHNERAAQETELDERRRELLTMANDLDDRRQQLKKLNADFLRRIDQERERTEADRRQLRREEAALLETKMRTQQHVDETAQRITEEQQAELESRAIELDRVQRVNTELRTQLHACADRDHVQRENQRLTRALARAQEGVELDAERQRLETELKAANEKIALVEKSCALSVKEHELKLKLEQTKYNELMLSFKEQSEKLRKLATEQKQVMLKQLNMDRHRPRHVAHSSSMLPSDTHNNNNNTNSVSTDDDQLTPDYVKQARERLMQLDRETRSIEQTTAMLRSTSASLTAQRPQLSVMPLRQTQQHHQQQQQMNNTTIESEQPIGTSTPKKQVNQQYNDAAQVNQFDADELWRRRVQAQQRINDAVDVQPQQQQPLQQQQQQQQQQPQQHQQQPQQQQQQPQQATATTSTTQEKDAPGSTNIDPMMQQYMQMVMQQRMKQAETQNQDGSAAQQSTSNVVEKQSSEESLKIVKVRTKANDTDDDDFDW